MSLFRILLIVVIGWLVIRIVNVFLRLKHGSEQQRTGDGSGAHPTRRQGPDDFSRENIKDAEFEDLTPSPKPPPNPPAQT
jgi:hypothetical protein